MALARKLSKGVSNLKEKDGTHIQTQTCTQAQEDIGYLILVCK